HSCGAISPILPDLIEMGVDIINPVQISAGNMDPARLKREFGQHLVFWGGGVDTQHTLPLGTVKEVEAEVKELISIFAPGGGFVFTTVHNIQADVTPEKILAVYRTAQEYGRYPLKTSEGISLVNS
ncbi:MAG TPA: methyltransferase, partial [Anaerolineae bacterium]|nr:methyltransferase [Anaerolineae bacterium]